MCRSHRRIVCSLYGRLLKINTISLGYVKWISYISSVGKSGMNHLTTLTQLKLKQRIKEQIFEVATDKQNVKGVLHFKPHLRIKESIAKRFTKNWRGLVHSDLLEMFPVEMKLLSEVGINSKGRELYDKTLMGTKMTTCEITAALASMYLQDKLNKVQYNY